MRFGQGATLGSYEILSLLGAGGMGEVYRARDPRLGREVAIKVLPEELARDAERIARFEREARSLAALNHPNVATLHGFEAHGDCRFLVMELVEGEDLAARIERGPIPLEEALPIFLQIAEGLEAAHEKQILHRDLKPANVKVDTDGRVKILDFGLAKAMADEPRAAAAFSVGDFTHSPTLSAQATRAGTLLGTAAYMSPEQARGLPADPRADVWSFGCCFYEALTGKRPFAGEDLPQTLAAVLKDTPDWSALPADLPRHLAVLVRRSLEKNRRARVQSMGDVRVELQESLAPPAAVAPATGVARGGSREDRVKWRRQSLWVAGVVAAFVSGLFFAPGRTADRSTSSPTSHIPLAVPGEGITNWFPGTPQLAISPDGRRVAYVGYERDYPAIWLLDLHNPGGAMPVDGALGRWGPFFSPDGETLGFQSDRISVLPLSGRESRPVAREIRIRGGNATWDQGWIYYVDPTRGISRVGATGNDPPQPVTKAPPSTAHNYPQVLPGGQFILHSLRQAEKGLASVAVTKIATGEQTVLFERGFAPRYLPTGHLVVGQEDVLLAMPLDLDTLKVGRSVPVLHGVATDASSGVAAYAVSDSGVLVYLSAAPERDHWLVRLRPGDAPERLNDEPIDFDYEGLAVSPDGQRVVVARNDLDLWAFDLPARDVDTRLTTDPARDASPIWGPGDGMVTFLSTQGGGWGLYTRRVDGQGREESLVVDHEAAKWPYSWSPGGERLLYSQADPESKVDLWTVPAGNPQGAEIFLRTQFNEDMPAFSPDGKWVAYSSDETGQWQIYVTSYPDQDVKKRVSRDWGMAPRWSPDGKRIFYGRGERVMMVEAMDSRWTPSAPETFVEGISPPANWALTPDGQAVISLERRPPIGLHMVQNWFAELERLVPTER